MPNSPRTNYTVYVTIETSLSLQVEAESEEDAVGIAAEVLNKENIHSGSNFNMLDYLLNWKRVVATEDDENEAC